LERILVQSMADALAEQGGEVDRQAINDGVRVEKPEGSGMVTEIVVKVAVVLLSKYSAELIDKVWRDHVWPRLQAHFGRQIEQRETVEPDSR
jgi:hypothetical protein